MSSYQRFLPSRRLVLGSALLPAGSLAARAAPPSLRIQVSDAVITVSRLGAAEPLLVDNVRADFRPYLHPLRAPDGRGVLTEFSPGHHKHQTGIFWGFTRVKGRDYYHHPEGTHWRRVAVGPARASGSSARWSSTYELLDENGAAVLRHEERWTLTDDGPRYWIDLDWQGRALRDLTFEKYDYGGLFTRLHWRKETGGEVVTSEGKANGDAEGQRARWVDMAVPLEGRDDRAHVVLMDHPRNDGHPLPWRVDSQLGVGPSRARLGDWSLARGKIARFRHRALIYTGATDRSLVERVWKSFAR